MLSNNVSMRWQNVFCHTGLLLYSSRPIVEIIIHYSHDFLSECAVGARRGSLVLIISRQKAIGQIADAVLFIFSLKQARHETWGLYESSQYDLFRHSNWVRARVDY